jgi:hypothetical protein
MQRRPAAFETTESPDNRRRMDWFVGRQNTPEVIARAWRFCGLRVAMRVQRVAEYVLPVVCC